MRQPTLIVASLLGVVSVGWLVGLWPWGGHSQTREAIAIASLLASILPWLVVARRRFWTFQASDRLPWRVAVDGLVAFSVVAFPLGVALVNHFFPGPAQSPGWIGEPAHGVNAFALVAMSILASIATAVLAFGIQLVRDRWQPFATAIAASVQIGQWVYLSWSQS